MAGLLRDGMAVSIALALAAGSVCGLVRRAALSISRDFRWLAPDTLGIDDRVTGMLTRQRGDNILSHRVGRTAPLPCLTWPAVLTDRELLQGRNTALAAPTALTLADGTIRKD